MNIVKKLTPDEYLAQLMKLHNLKQTDLKDCAPQSRISEILNRKRLISKSIAKKLAVRFNVEVGNFIE